MLDVMGDGHHRHGTPDMRACASGGRLSAVAVLAMGTHYPPVFAALASSARQAQYLQSYSNKLGVSASLDRLVYQVWVLCGDSEMAAGSVWWALDKAAYYRLGNLTAIVDVNRRGQRGPTKLERAWTPTGARTKRSAAPRLWWTDRTSPRSTRRWLPPGRPAGRPTVVLAKTAKGKGFPEIEDQNDWHGRVRAGAGSGSARCTACPAPAPGRTDKTRRYHRAQTAAARPRPDGPLKPTPHVPRAGPGGVPAGAPRSSA